jgi:hypothetical protein
MLTEMEACRITQSSLLEFLFTDSPTVVFRVFALCLLKLLVIHLDQRTGFFLKLHLSHGACFRLTLLHRVSSWLLVLLGVSQREVSWGVRFQYFGRQRRGIGAIISNWFSSEKGSQSCVGISEMQMTNRNARSETGCRARAHDGDQQGPCAVQENKVHVVHSVDRSSPTDNIVWQEHSFFHLFSYYCSRMNAIKFIRTHSAP